MTAATHIPATEGSATHRAAAQRPATDPAAGLTAAEADRRHQAGEGNTYRSPTSRSYVQIFRDNSYPLINGPLLLVSAALISFGAVTEAVMTGLPVFGNIAIGVVQGSRAKRQLDRVALLSEAPATVVRDGAEHRDRAVRDRARGHRRRQLAATRSRSTAASSRRSACRSTSPS